jgi:hypothetical protein
MISPLHLSEDEIAEVLENADVIETWLTAVRGLAYTAIADGRDIPGWKLVPKRAVRKWKDARLVKQRLASEGLSGFLTEDLITPAQAEKLAKKQGIQLDLFDLIDAESSGMKLARETDSREAATRTAASEFAE